MVGRDATHDRIHVSLRLRQADAGFQTRDNVQVVATAVGKLFRTERQRHPQTHFPFEELKTGGHHTYDGEFLAVQQNVAIEDLWISTIARLPQTVTEHCDLVAAG